MHSMPATLGMWLALPAVACRWRQSDLLCFKSPKLDPVVTCHLESQNYYLSHQESINTLATLQPKSTIPREGQICKPVIAQKRQTLGILKRAPCSSQTFSDQNECEKSFHGNSISHLIK
jgi:hypothetical protein